MKIVKTIIAVGVIALISTNLSAQEITAFPGTWGEQFYQDKEKLTWSAVNKIMRESQVAKVEWQKSKKLALGGLVFGLANLGSTVWLISNIDKNKPLTRTDYCRRWHRTCRYDILSKHLQIINDVRS